jgi:3-isopropylmalate/(R)-2-methylmalate dehydratase small subunit
MRPGVRAAWFRGRRNPARRAQLGCGSSREHAAWALEDYGFKAVIAPSFGDIFRSNAVKSGLVPVIVAGEAASALRLALIDHNALVVDVEQLEVRHPDGLVIPFALDPYDQESLVGGLDDIARTLQREDEIAAYEASHPGRFDATRWRSQAGAGE